MRAREPDPLHAVDGVHRFQQAAEIAGRIVRRRVVVDDLAEQLYLTVACIGRFADLRQDVGLRAHPLVPSRIRDDTEAAELVAPFDDRDVGLHRIGAPGHPRREAHIAVRVEVDQRDGSRFAAADSRPARIDSRPLLAPFLCRPGDQHRQLADGLRTDDHVGDAGQASENGLAFLLRDASGNGDNRVVSLFGSELPQLAEPRVELLLGALAHAARVDDDEVGIDRFGRRLEAGLLEEPGHPLRVVDVHLAAERLDQVFTRH